MRISRKEIDAAMFKLSELTNGAPVQNPMIIHQVLEAAYLVRKARKAAKREGARENGEPVDVNEMKRVHDERDKKVSEPTPKPLTIEAGKSYRTRDGRRAYVDLIDHELSYPIRGRVSPFHVGWALNGAYFHGAMVPHEFDLISEWQE